jgi:uncharacterized protein (DUF1778 family)
MKKKKVSEAQMRATKKYEEKAYFSAHVRFPANKEELIRRAAGKSLNGFIVQAVLEKIEKSENNC